VATGALRGGSGSGKGLRGVQESRLGENGHTRCCRTRGEAEGAPAWASRWGIDGAVHPCTTLTKGLFRAVLLSARERGATAGRRPGGRLAREGEFGAAAPTAGRGEGGGLGLRRGQGHSGRRAHQRHRHGLGLWDAAAALPSRRFAGGLLRVRGDSLTPLSQIAILEEETKVLENNSCETVKAVLRFRINHSAENSRSRSVMRQTLQSSIAAVLSHEPSHSSTAGAG